MKGLYNHGIQTEQSDIRAHVSVSDNTVYVFSTKKAISIISKYKLKSVDVYSKVHGKKMITAKGYLAPVNILKPRKIRAKKIIESAGFIKGNYSTTSDKGRKAQKVVEVLLRQGLFPLPTTPNIVTNVEMQRQGYDIVVRGTWKIEIKCDWRIGDTNNVFLQVAETNPLKQY